MYANPVISTKNSKNQKKIFVRIVKFINYKITVTFSYVLSQISSLTSQTIANTRYRYEIFYNKASNNFLSELSFDYNSDKGAPENSNPKLNFGFQSLTDIYFLLFNQARYQIENVFELGIGSNFIDTPSNMGENGTPGASLRMWRDFFPNANIFGGDVDSRILFEEARIKTFYVDQTKSESIIELWNNIDKEFDLIIEDGLHEVDANINFLKYSFFKLKPGGFYIIEDIQRKKDVDIISKFLVSNKFNFYVFRFDKNKNKLTTNYFIVIIK